MTAKMQNQLNDFIVKARRRFWRKTLDISEVQNRLTAKKQEEFETLLNERSFMDFTESNIRQFILNLIGSHERTLMDSVLEVFDRFTIRHAYDEKLQTENIHYFNGWKTNKAFKVSRRVIIPVYGTCGSAFKNWNAKWALNYGAASKLRDIDIVMNYFDGAPGYVSISKALEDAFSRGQSTKIESTYFTMNAYQKGTLHMTFNDENILRRFNVAACRGKNMLPQDYGAKKYAEASVEEKAVIDSFEGERSYTVNRNQLLFAANAQYKQIPA
jgi:hypothetical protein